MRGSIECLGEREGGGGGGGGDRLPAGCGATRRRRAAELRPQALHAQAAGQRGPPGEATRARQREGVAE